MFKTLTKIEFSGQNDDNNRNIKNTIAIALWEIPDGTFLNLGCCEYDSYACCHDNRKKNINNKAKCFPRNNDEYVVYVKAENKKLKEHIPLKLQQF